MSEGKLAELADRVAELEGRVAELEKIPHRWVTGRAKCTVKGIFDELVQLVQRDVAERNESASESFRFEAKRDDHSGVPILSIEEIWEDNLPPIVGCTIACNEINPPNCVFIGKWNKYTLNGSGFRIEPLPWDGGDAQCKLRILNSNGEEHSSIDYNDLWKFVQEFLEPVLFRV